jgi:hypothetical protein
MMRIAKPKASGALRFARTVTGWTGRGLEASLDMSDGGSRKVASLHFFQIHPNPRRRCESVIDRALPCTRAYYPVFLNIADSAPRTAPINRLVGHGLLPCVIYLRDDVCTAYAHNANHLAQSV